MIRKLCETLFGLALLGKQNNVIDGFLLIINRRYEISEADLCMILQGMKELSLNLVPEIIQLQYIYIPLNIFCCILIVDGTIQVSCNGPVDITLMGKKS